jgi:hypothetical protein
VFIVLSGEDTTRLTYLIFVTSSHVEREHYSSCNSAAADSFRVESSFKRK